VAFEQGIDVMLFVIDIQLMCLWHPPVLFDSLGRMILDPASSWNLHDGHAGEMYHCIVISASVQR
jgi:hypothetical protein